MLVVNANKQQTDKNTNGVFDYVRYPDFDQFLGFLPGTGFAVNTNGDITPETFGTKAMTIGSSDINALFVQNRESNLFGTPNQGNIGTANNIVLLKVNTSGAVIEHCLRFGSAGQLKAGHIVGRNIVWNGFCRDTNSTITLTYAKLKVGLMHTDGTITYANNNIDLSGLETSARQLIKSTNAGITSLDGDRIIVEFDIKGSSSATTGITIAPGYLGSPTDAPLGINSSSPSPIQVSVE